MTHFADPALPGMDAGAPEPATTGPTGAARGARDHLMAELRVQFDGSAYHHGGRHFERLTDALAYARRAAVQELADGDFHPTPVAPTPGPS